MTSRFLEWRARMLREMMALGVVGDAGLALVEEPGTWEEELHKRLNEALCTAGRCAKELTARDRQLVELQDEIVLLTHKLGQARQDVTNLSASLGSCGAKLAEAQAMNAEWRRRWDQLEPLQQAEAMPHAKLLGIVMYLHGIVDVEITEDDIKRIPSGHGLVFGEKPERKGVIRLRWMSASQIAEIGVAPGQTKRI